MCCPLGVNSYKYKYKSAMLLSKLCLMEYTVIRHKMKTTFLILCRSPSCQNKTDQDIISQCPRVSDRRVTAVVPLHPVGCTWTTRLTIAQYLWLAVPKQFLQCSGEHCPAGRVHVMFMNARFISGRLHCYSQTTHFQTKDPSGQIKAVTSLNALLILISNSTMPIRTCVLQFFTSYV